MMELGHQLHLTGKFRVWTLREFLFAQGWLSRIPDLGMPVPLERVSILLGHSSVKITEKYYAPWVRSRQERLEADMRNAWKDDPMREGTKRVQRQNARPN